MPLQNIGTVYRKELTDSLRDRRTLISTLLVPLLLFPILSVGFAALAVTLEKKAKEEIPKVIEARLDANHVPSSILIPFRIKQDNVAPLEKVGGAELGGIIGYMVILLCLTGGMYPAMDLTAGKKERGTMETILSSPISRLDLVLGKFFLVLTASLVTAALSVVSMGVSFWGMRQLKALDVSKNPDAAGMQLHIGFTAVLSVFLMALPLAVPFSLR